MNLFLRNIILTGVMLLGILYSSTTFAGNEKKERNLSGTHIDSGTESLLPNTQDSGDRINSGSTDESKEQSDTGSIDRNEQRTSIEKQADEEKVKKDINTYIIDSYKAQGTKILKDLDTKLQKIIPDPNERKEAYKKIRTALELRKKRIESTKTSDIKKMILEEFLDHMTDNLNKKIDEIKT